MYIHLPLEGISMVYMIVLIGKHKVESHFGHSGVFYAYICIELFTCTRIYVVDIRQTDKGRPS